MNTHRHQPDDHQQPDDPAAPAGDASADSPASDSPPTLAEIAAFTRRLRALSAAGSDADPVELAAFLADKAALFARIPGAEPEPEPPDPHDPDADDPDADDPAADDPDGDGR